MIRNFLFLTIFALLTFGAATVDAKAYPGNQQCTQEVKQCPDGSYVGRTGKRCSFAPCPTTPPICIPDNVICAAGTKCAPQCPPVTSKCRQDAKACPNGTFVTRSGPYCTFANCPGPVACTDVVKMCDDGSVVSPSGPYCQMPECPKTVQPVMCTQETKICPSGVAVGRTGPKCEFAACPEETKTKKK